MADPATAAATAGAAAAASSAPVLGGICTDADKLGYDSTTNQQVVCEGNTWDKAPITTGVHATGSSCDRPDIPVFAMSTSDDGYLIECDPATRVWSRHQG
ncbi:non-specific serine/threonine kinase domain protein [Mycobacterium xenopi 4042]|uniref:Non-specific serine/threonine kinase domain protein n=1 Tax=Mycobacterium xenopi 4042 TaxID=1299334 RepID=X7YNG2_MYCXE|nr:non-specific serine/threonine kinase domain protein [Mycobacterium xenopi 4042]EUA35268.1 non-specific serine/threonine kinase domain protein [Mycobacterium xenopi 3993]